MIQLQFPPLKSGYTFPHKATYLPIVGIHFFFSASFVFFYINIFKVRVRPILFLIKFMSYGSQFY